MNTDIMYHAFGVSKQECLGIRHKDNQIIVEIETPREKDCCSCCGSRNVARSGSHRRLFRSVPFGVRPCVLEMNVHRLVCKECGAIAQEEIDFAKGKRRHTQCFANMVIDLSRFATIKEMPKKCLTCGCKRHMTQKSGNSPKWPPPSRLTSHSSSLGMTIPYPMAR